MSPLHEPLRDGDERRRTILLVDDDEVFLMLAKEALTQRGFEIVEANSGERALEVLERWTPDVVVLDALMPGLDGFETCVALRGLPGFDKMPVLMLTGLDDEWSINRAFQCGATDFFVKSRQWALLAGRLHYLLHADHTRRELERSREKLARAQDLARMGSVDWWRVDGQVLGRLEVSEEGLRVFGLGPDDRPSLLDLLRMVAPADRHALVATLRTRVSSNHVLNHDLPMTLPDGRHRTIHIEAEPEFDEYGQIECYTGIVQDLTDRRRAEDQIRHLANYDALTNLPNRRQLIWRAERALEAARRMGHQVALLLIDLDRFKVINDTLGHTAGDELLMEVAYRLRGCVRHCVDQYEGVIETAGMRSHRSLEAVGRLGGDEFVALLPDVWDEADAQRVAQRVLEALREPVLLEGQDCFATASVGIAIFPRDGDTVLDLLRNADVAMYAVKAQGRNDALTYSARLSSRGRERLQLESALHKALDRDELVLHYQPKVDILHGRVCGFEALMRWHRGGSIVQPNDFIPVAEETGLIVPMSEWLIREAARQARRWRDSFGFDGAIAINLPSRMFKRTDLVDLISEATEAAGVDPSMLLLEITETELMRDQGSVPVLHKLKALGAEISIDDFGTGYSSLSYLPRLPISELKIDHGFVRDLGSQSQSTPVVTAIIALARSLSLRVVAEGVETVDQLDELYRLGCTTMQGYLFARPMPAATVERWLTEVELPRKAPWIAGVPARLSVVAEPLPAGHAPADAGDATADLDPSPRA